MRWAAHPLVNALSCAYKCDSIHQSLAGPKFITPALTTSSKWNMTVCWWKYSALLVHICTIMNLCERHEISLPVSACGFHTIALIYMIWTLSLLYAGSTVSLEVIAALKDGAQSYISTSITFEWSLLSWLCGMACSGFWLGTFLNIHFLVSDEYMHGLDGKIHVCSGIIFFISWAVKTWL